jgi:hypothetical protein
MTNQSKVRDAVKELIERMQQVHAAPVLAVG